jgi:hypothetical protein
MDDAILGALALIELVGRPIDGRTLDELGALLGMDSSRVALRLAGMLRCYIEANGTPVQAWVDEYRSRELADDLPPGMA